jgi:hypothetical protein
MYTFTLVGLAPIGTLVAGTLAQQIGAPWAMRVAGSICLLGAIWVGVRLIEKAADQSDKLSPEERESNDPSDRRRR